MIRESRASLFCLWGFPSRLYNDLPVGFSWCWRRSLPVSPAQSLAPLQCKQNPLCPQLCFWHQLLKGNSSSWLLCFTYRQLFSSPSLHHPFLPFPAQFGLICRPYCSLLCSFFPFFFHFGCCFSCFKLFSFHCLLEKRLVLGFVRAADAHLLPSSLSGGCS